MSDPPPPPPPQGPQPLNYAGAPPVPPGYSAAPLNYAPPARNDLRQIAVRQKAIMYCILGYIVFAIAQLAPLPQELKVVAALGVVAAAITGAVFVFMLAVAVYNTGLGILLGLLTLVPLIGLIVLLIVNGKATATLRAHGIRVGLMGAKTSQIPQAGVING